MSANSALSDHSLGRDNECQTCVAPARRPCFPIVLDTAFSDEFLIQHEHLVVWVKCEPDDLPGVDRIVKVYDASVRARGANLWLYGNVPGSREPVLDREPMLLRCDVAVCPLGICNPRLPLLGL